MLYIYSRVAQLKNSNKSNIENKHSDIKEK